MFKLYEIPALLKDFHKRQFTFPERVFLAAKDGNHSRRKSRIVSITMKTELNSYAFYRNVLMT